MKVVIQLEALTLSMEHMSWERNTYSNTNTLNKEITSRCSLAFQ